MLPHFTPHRIVQMRPVAAAVTRSVVCVCDLAEKKTDEPTEIPTPVGPRNHVVDGVHIGAAW